MLSLSTIPYLIPNNYLSAGLSTLKHRTNDNMSGGLSRQESDQFYMPLEPYPSMKAWLRFDSGITIKDYAYQGTVCKTETVRNQYSQTVKRPLKRTIADDNITEGPVYSITNGLNQFFRIENSQHLKIQNILATANIYQISMIISPMFYYTPEAGSTTTPMRFVMSRVNRPIMVSAYP